MWSFPRVSQKINKILRNAMLSSFGYQMLCSQSEKLGHAARFVSAWSEDSSSSFGPRALCQLAEGKRMALVPFSSSALRQGGVRYLFLNVCGLGGSV